MTRRAVVVSWSLLALSACAVSASTSTHSGTTPSVGDAQGPGKPAHTPSGAGATPAPAADPGGGGPPVAGGTAGAGATACTPSLADLATSLFGGRVLITLPKGIELVEQNPFYAQSAAPQQVTSCGAQVRYAAVGFFEWPAGASLTQVRDQLLELRGIPQATLSWTEEGTRGRHYTAAYSAAQDPNTQAPPARGWVVLRDAPNDKFAYFAVFESDEAAWNELRPVFLEAGRHLLVKPRAIQGPEQVAAPPPKEPEAKPKKKPKAAKKLAPAP